MNSSSSALLSRITGSKTKKDKSSKTIAKQEDQHDYERDILLDEDIDDYNAFDYEDQQVQLMLRDHHYRQLSKNSQF